MDNSASPHLIEKDTNEVKNLNTISLQLHNLRINLGTQAKDSGSNDNKIFYLPPVPPPSSAPPSYLYQFPNTLGSYNSPRTAGFKNFLLAKDTSHRLDATEISLEKEWINFLSAYQNSSGTQSNSSKSTCSRFHPYSQPALPPTSKTRRKNNQDGLKSLK
ncbi:MAG: hypothetical protein JWM09_1386 [Francisellaceae bacterium]|nr:hypothetical protein [Francisellaceae bacterium]